MTRPTYANVASTLALVVALGGTAYAAGPRNSVGTPQLKKNAVTTAKIKNGAVTATKIKDGTVGTGDLSAEARALARSGPATVMSGGVSKLPAVASGAAFVRAPISGTIVSGSPDYEYQTLTPAMPLRASGLAVTIAKDLPADTSVDVTLMATTNRSGGDEPTSLTCTITGTAGADDRACTSSGSAVVAGMSIVYVLYVVRGVGVTADPLIGRHALLLSPAS